MLEHELSRLKEWFAGYAAGHKTNEQTTDAALDLKIHHTALVTANALCISQRLGWPAEAARTAQAAALLHDTGRFPQMARFKTFDDRQSRDHAVLSVEAILSGGALRGLTGREQRLILSAVAWHNKRTVPPELPRDELPLLYLLRDADKLDIMRFFCEYYAVCEQQPNPLLEFGLPASGPCSEKVLADLTAGRLADLADARNVNDVRLIKLSWIYDLYYPVSRGIFLENRYVEKTLAALPDIPGLAERLTAYLNM